MKLEEKMENEDRTTGVNERWMNIRKHIVDAAKESIGYKKEKRAKKPWITDEMIKKMDERRKWKSVNTTTGQQNYRRLNNELRRETDKAREQW